VQARNRAEGPRADTEFFSLSRKAAWRQVASNACLWIRREARGHEGGCTFPVARSGLKQGRRCNAGREGTPVLTVVQEGVSGEEPGRPASPIDEIVREGARRMLAEALRAEVDAYIAAFAAERDDNGRRMVVRNGYHEPGEVLTSAGGRAGDGIQADRSRAGALARRQRPAPGCSGPGRRPLRTRQARRTRRAS
jgi:hypothetical protein